MIDDLKLRGFEQVNLGVEPTDIENKKMYFHYGFNELVKTGVEPNPDESSVAVEYCRKYL